MVEGQQDTVIETSKSLSKANAEIVLNQIYFPALAQLRRSCYKNLSKVGMRPAGAQFINAWIELDSLIRTNLSDSSSKELGDIEAFMVVFFDKSRPDYRELMRLGMSYARIVKSSGLFNLVKERTEMVSCMIEAPVKRGEGESSSFK